MNFFVFNILLKYELSENPIAHILILIKIYATFFSFFFIGIVEISIYNFKIR